MQKERMLSVRRIERVAKLNSSVALSARTKLNNIAVLLYIYTGARIELNHGAAKQEIARAELNIGTALRST